MLKNKILLLFILSLGLAGIFLSGCVYLAHLDESMFLKNFDNNQKEMQAEIDKEKDSFSQLKSDIEKGHLHKGMKKRNIVSLYGEPPLCRPAQPQSGFEETCIYRNPAGGMEAELVLLNFDAKHRLTNWKAE